MESKVPYISGTLNRKNSLIIILFNQSLRAGMDLLSTMGMYEKKTLPVMSILPLAASYVGYIVLSNLRCALMPRQPNARNHRTLKCMGFFSFLSSEAFWTPITSRLAHAKVLGTICFSVNLGFRAFNPGRPMPDSSSESRVSLNARTLTEAG